MINWVGHWGALHFSQGVLWRDAPGYLGAVLVIASFLTRTMIPLRALSAGSNACLAAYAYADAQYPLLALNAALLPLNLLRLAQMIRLVQRVRAATQGDRAMEWLKPYMRRQHCRQGQRLIAKGEQADRLYYIVSGRFEIQALGIRMAPGEFVGELGLLSPEGLRTQSVECVEPGDVLSIGYDQVHEMLFQNPDFGFYFMQLAARRLFDTNKMLQQELSRRVSNGLPAAPEPSD